MKKLLLTITIAFAALLMTNCRKNNVQPVNDGVEPFGDFEMSLTAGNGDDEKSSIEGLKIYWQLGDKLHVVDATNGYLGYLTAVEIGTPKTTAVFKGFITQPGVGHDCMFYFVGTNDFNIDDDCNYLFDVHEQYGGLSIYVGNAANDDYEPGSWKGDFNDISNGLQLMKNRNTITVDETMLAAHNFGDQIIHMRSMMAIAHINLQVNGTSMGGELTDIVTVNGAGCYSTGTLNIKTGALTPNAGDITLKKANGDYYMVLIPAVEAGSTLDLTFTAYGRGRYTDIAPTVAANKFYNKDTAKTINMTSPLYLSGDFTVASGKTVKFSKGNLYWNGSAFKMEANQWNFQPASAGTWVTNHVSHLFWSNTTDWQTSGKEPYASSYLYSTQTTNDNFFTNATPITSNPSFSVEGETGTWRTLSVTEWAYVLNISDATSGARTYKNRFAKAMVHGVKGLVVFPDGYNGNVAITPPGGMEAINNITVAFPTESIADATWAVMETAGAVFLPAAGYRNGTGVGGAGSGGSYWSSAPHEGDNYGAYCVDFYASSVGTRNSDRFYGNAVRLVR